MKFIKLFEEYSEDDLDDYYAKIESIDVGNQYGYALGKYNPDEEHVELGIIYIYPEYQGKGHGISLMKKFIEYVKNNTDASSIQLEVEPVENKRYNKDELTKFYSQFGFAPMFHNRMKLNLY